MRWSSGFNYWKTNDQSCKKSQSFKKSYAKLCPSGRMLKDDEIFGPIEMLISNKTSGVSGHVLMIDGGWTIWWKIVLQLF